MFCLIDCSAHYAIAVTSSDAGGRARLKAQGIDRCFFRHYAIITAAG